MIVYEATKKVFRQDVKENQIEIKIHDAFKKSFGHKTSQAEVRSWQNSMMYMNNVLDDSEIPEDAGISIEYKLPRSHKRIDFVVTGKNSNDRNTMVIVELKQWQEAQKTEEPGVVKSFVGGAVREVTHPSYQAWSYSTYLEDFNDAISKNNIKLSPCAYLHNCSNSDDLRSEIYKEDIARAPLFLRSDAQKLTDFIKSHVKFGDKDGLMYLVDKGTIKPTKKLADSFASMLEGNQEFVMIDDQKIAYERALNFINKSDSKNKKVLIIHGGPGTGKSVIAINLLVNLIKKQKNTQYVSKNAAPREVYSTKLTGVMTKSRYKSLFTGSGSFTSSDKNVFDALIVDEAHRLNEKSGLYSNLGENQVKEIIYAAKASIFFLDEDQRVALSDIGTADEIRHWAKKEGAELSEINLTSQFRCNGSDDYLLWLNKQLEINSIDYPISIQDSFDFRVFDSAIQMHYEISKKDSEGFPSRTVAGYCWDWVSAKKPDLYDIEIDDLKMKWNLKSHGSKWIIHPDSLSEAGCIHTCQGLEVDYIGVIVGPDLLFRNGAIVTNGLARPGRDKTIKGFRGMLKTKPEEAKKIVDRVIKNTYKTLMTRGTKGCFIFCTDKETNNYFKEILENEL